MLIRIKWQIVAETMQIFSSAHVTERSSISPWILMITCMQLYMQGSISHSRGWSRRATGETIRSTVSQWQAGSRRAACARIDPLAYPARLLPGAQDWIHGKWSRGPGGVCCCMRTTRHVRPWTHSTHDPCTGSHIDRSMRACTDGGPRTTTTFFSSRLS
jgi:hypothetical protein